MRTPTIELGVNFIGRQSKPLTKEDQLSISAFIKKVKGVAGLIKESLKNQQNNLYEKFSFAELIN